MSGIHLIMSNPWTDKGNVLIEAKLLRTRQDGLSDRLEKIALAELREDENTRKQCLQQFKEWIKKNEDLENCSTENNFLLRFLRVKKFSIPMAQQTLLKYLNFRKRFKEFMYGMDYTHNDLINNGYVFVSPFRDLSGRRVIIYNLSKVDPNKYSGRDICQAHVITYETLLNDEENQIVGINHVADLGGLSAAFLTLFSISEFATIIRWGEQSIPMRHKEVNVLKFPTAFKYVYEFAQSNVKSQKLKERILLHNTLSDLHRKVDKRCLPLEMGGKMPMKDMIELWKEELAAKRETLLSYDAMNLRSDRGILCRRNKFSLDDTEKGSLPGSFRKLEVD